MKRDCDTRQKLLTTVLALLWEQSYGSVSVDDICDRAGLNKGSFYHFFPSKSDLAVAALDEHWAGIRQQMDHYFSPLAPPLNRLAAYCDWLYTHQKCQGDLSCKICGCPYTSIGSELGTQDEKIRLKVTHILEQQTAYLESALRDGAAEGSLDAIDPKALARYLMALIQGAQLLSRIKNDIAPMTALRAGLERLLGVKLPAEGNK